MARKQYSEQELKSRLTKEQYEVTQNSGTERPFSGEYFNTKASGAYHCVVCDVELFTSDTKFDSGTGWPSFSEPSVAENIETSVDTSHGQVRTEVSCAECGAHLGHVFPDGPAPGGDRFCMNSASLNLKEDDL